MNGTTAIPSPIHEYLANWLLYQRLFDIVATPRDPLWWTSILLQGEPLFLSNLQPILVYLMCRKVTFLL